MQWKKDILLILYVISIALVTSRGDILSPGHLLNSLMRRVKTHVSGKGIS